MLRSLSALVAVLVTALAATAADPLNILFLGDNAGHKPAARFAQLQPVLAERGINLTYTDKVSDLNPTTLAKYDGLMIFANHTEWKPENETALLDYVNSGKGFIPLHCASFCFTKSQPYIDLVGAQFRSHTTGVFRTTTTMPDHPIMAGCDSFGSWDETYVHFKHNEKDRTVLEVRTDGAIKEPYTWVRNQGKGRVFYTAWGHDQRTWSHQGFHTLVERGTKWACGKDLKDATVYHDRPKMTEFAADAPPFKMVPATIPFYAPGRGGSREPVKEMQSPLSASDSLKHYTTPVDFEMKTFVTEDQLGGGKPICMTWDERGRLWLALTFDYPNELKRDGEGRDKIVLCEDTDGDGVCDKVTMFADKLSIPTSMLPIRGGLLVHMAPDTIFLKDTKGTGTADLRQKVITGWSTKDTHAGPSNLHYGLDNWIYGIVGYSGFNGTIAEEKFRFSQGLYRFKLDPAETGVKVTKFEFLRSTNNNSWGVAFNEEGELFGSTANGCPLVHLPIPNRYYEKVKGLSPGGPLERITLDNHMEPVTEKIRQVDWHGGFTAAANCAIYTARTYPPEYWNKVAFVSEPTGHLVATLPLQKNGTDYIARYGWNLCASRDDWAAPIDAQVGPDGHMWVIDWYNVIVQHNPTPQGYKTGAGGAYEIPLRDKKYGRVYRVVYTKAKPEPRVDLKDADLQKLFETLAHHNMTWRLHAQRLILEKWTHKDLENPNLTIKVKLDDDMLANFDRHHSAIKYNNDSARFAASMANLPNGALKTLRTLLNIADREKPAHQVAIEILKRHLRTPATLADHNLADALTIAATVHAAAFLEDVVGSETPLPPEARKVVGIVAANFTATASAEDVSRLLTKLAAAKDKALAESILTGLAASWPDGKKLALTADGEKAVGNLLPSVSASSRLRLLKLAATWGVKGLDAQLDVLTKDLLTTMADEKSSDSSRIDAAKQIIEFRPADEAAATAVMAALTAKASPALAGGLIDALSNSKAPSVGAAVSAKLKDLPPTVRANALRVVLARPASTAAFLDAVESGALRFDMLALDQKTALTTHPDKAIAARAKKLLAAGGGLPDADRQKVIDEFASILKETGDAAAGKKLFTTHCAKCHKHGAEGQVIGPDLTGFAVHPKHEILIAVLDPSRSVEGNYKSYTAMLQDGRVITGLLAAESKTSVDLLDAENKRHTIARDDLDTLKESPKSLMPEGFEKQMTKAELSNLLEFLTLKGKYVPIPLDKAATVVSSKGMFNDLDSVGERLVLKSWAPMEFKGVPFHLIDPMGTTKKNVILLNSENGTVPPTMPKSVTLPCNTPAKAIHILGGIAGWAAQAPSANGTVSMTVRLLYADGKTEDHPLKDGTHIADYIRRIDVPGSEFAVSGTGRQQVRYLSITPKRTAEIKTIEFVKGPDKTAPVVVAVTIETP